MKWLGRALLVVVVASAAALRQAPPAGGEVPTNPIGCQAEVTVTTPEKAVYRLDAADRAVRIARDGEYSWRGAVGSPTHNQSGAVALRIAWFEVNLVKWRSTNVRDETSHRSSGRLPAYISYLPRGTYTVVGSHSADEGSCRGRTDVVLGGGPFSSVGGTAALAGSALYTVLFLLAGRRFGRRGRPVLGAVAGLLLGFLLAVDLLMLSVIPSGSSLFAVLPALFLAGGVGFAAWCPFGRRR